MSLVCVLQNMVGRGEVDEDLEGETKEECEKYGKVVKCVIFEVRRLDESTGRDLDSPQRARRSRLSPLLRSPRFSTTRPSGYSWSSRGWSRPSKVSGAPPTIRSCFRRRHARPGFPCCVFLGAGKLARRRQRLPTIV